MNEVPVVAGKPPKRVPDFLIDYAPTRYRKRLTPVSRIPATGRIGEVWQVAAERHPHDPVITDRAPDVDPGGSPARNYTQWAELVDELAAALGALGVQAGDRVAVAKRNHLDVALLGSAAARVGAVPALISDNHPPEVMATLLGRLERPFLIVDRQALERMDISAATASRLTERTVCLEAVTGRPDVVAFDSLRNAGPVTPRLRPAGEPMIITHTSGTTGTPKLVMHSAESLYSLALLEAEHWPVFGLRQDDTMAFCEPYCHQRVITGLLTLATVAPKMILMSDPLSPRVRELLIEHAPTFVETLPNIYLAWEALARDPARLFRNVRVYVSSYDAIHTRTVRTFLGATDRRLPLWVQSWSQTEAGSVAFRPYVRRSVRKRGQRPSPTQLLGWPLPTYGKARAVDPDDGRPVPAGQVGLIQYAAPGRCLGYVGEQDRHFRKRTGPWWNLGDMAVINRLGALRLIDREIDRIPGSSSLELEDVLLDRLPETTEVIVLGVAGEQPQPVFSTTGDAPIDPARWQRATANLPALASPVQIKWSEFPRTATWKVRRGALREILRSGASGFGYGTWT
jgi:acyl-coenzyme A synthetase/AMP-(fatty) acid ligase